MPFTNIPITQGYGDNETQTNVIQGYIDGYGDFSLRAGLDPDGNLELVLYSDSEDIISAIRGVTTTDGATYHINYSPPTHPQRELT